MQHLEPSHFFTILFNPKPMDPCLQPTVVPFRPSHAASFSPTAQLKAFLQQVGAALSTVTTMDLYMEDDLSSEDRTVQLSEGMVLMASACPSLRTLISRGPLSTAFLQRLGQNCPHLSFISIHAEPEDVPYMHRTVPLMPSLLPHITKLSFPYLGGGPGSELPDLSQHSHITTLKMTSFTFAAVSNWRRLPPNLQHVKCCKILAMPAASFGGARRVLASLLTLGTRVTVMPLEDLNQILRAAPVLQELSTPGGENFLIECSLDSSSVAFDLSFLHQRMQAGTRMKGILRVEGSQGQAGGAAQALLISRLPRMTLVKRCSFTKVSHAELQRLLSMFPNVEALVLDSFRGMSDSQLQDLAVCVHITTLLLEFSSRVSPQGLVALCQRLPALRRFSCGGCTQLRRIALAGCAQLLAQQSGRIVQMEDLST